MIHFGSWHQMVLRCTLNTERMLDQVLFPGTLPLAAIELASFGITFFVICTGDLGLVLVTVLSVG